MAQAGIAAAIDSAPLDDWSKFAKATGLKAAILKKIRPIITEKDPNAIPIPNEPDVELRDTEYVPFTYEGGISAFIKSEVYPYAPDAYVDEKQTKIGYELSFNKYFLKPEEMRSMGDILSALKLLESETDGMIADIIGGFENDH